MSARRNAFRTGPAPVVADDVALGPPSPIPDAHGRAARPRSRARRAAAQLALLAAAWVLMLAAAQVTAREAALPALARVLAALTDVEGLLTAREQAIRGSATTGGAGSAGGPVAVPGFPVPAAGLTTGAVRSGTRAEWREPLLASGAAALYERGMAAFAPEGAGTEGALLSTGASAAFLIEALSASRHAVATAAAIALGLGVLALAVRLVRLGPQGEPPEGASRFVAVGLALVAAAALSAAVALAAMAALSVMGLVSTSPLGDEVWAVARALAWTPLRDALYLAAAGTVIALPAAGVAIWLGAGAEHAERADEVGPGAARR